MDPPLACSWFLPSLSATEVSEGPIPDPLTVSWGSGSTWVIATHLVNIDGEGNGDVYQVSEGEAGD